MPTEFTVTVQKTGSSLQIVLPKPVTDGLRIKQGDQLKLIVNDSEIIVKKFK